MATNRIEQEIVVKVIGGKDVGALAKEIKDLEKQKAKLVVDADTDEARKELDAIDKQLAALKSEKAELEVTAQVNQALDALDEVASEAKKAEAAAEALGDALGPELAAGVDLDRVVGEFRDMGLSLDTVTANADKLGGKLKEIAATDPGGNLDQAFRRAKGGVDDLGKSADSSRSVLANMVGNASQDVGVLGGVAGSAGVALGQMGEYMADAAFSGDKFTTIVANFAKVAGPIAAIATVLSVVQGVMASNEQRAAAAAKATEDYGQAMQDSANDALGFADVMRDNIAEMQNFSGAATETGDILKDVASNIPLVGQLFAAPTVDVTEVFNKIDVGLVKVGKAIGGNVHDWNDLQAALKEAHDQGRITNDQFDQSTKFINEQRDAVKNAEEAQTFHNVALGEANDLYDELTKKKDPLGQLTEQWDVLFDAIEKGTLGSERATTAINVLHTELGLDPSDVLTTAIEGLDQKQQDAADAAEEHTDALEDQRQAAKELAEEMKDYAINVSKADGELVNMSGTFDRMATAGDALSRVFDLGNAAEDAAGEVRDIELAIEGLSEIEVDVGDVLAGSVKADDFLDAIDGIRPQIQAKITEAFSTDGTEEARATALRYIAEVTKELGGKFTPEQVAKLLGLEDFEATIGIAIAQSAVDKAKRQLEVLVGVGGETPYTASIALALDAGAITGEQAQQLIQPKLEDAGVTIPTELAVPATAETLAAAQRALDRAKPLTVQVKAQIEDIARFLANDAGGTVQPPGGWVAEKRPEIINDRWLAVSPTLVPPGTRVTSGARTARILKHGGLRGLKRYDSGGTVPAMVTNNVKVNVHLPAGANGADVVRQVNRWQRRNGAPV